jgi:hypothetical protein
MSIPRDRGRRKRFFRKLGRFSHGLGEPGAVPEARIRIMIVFGWPAAGGRPESAGVGRQGVRVDGGFVCFAGAPARIKICGGQVDRHSDGREATSTSWQGDARLVLVARRRFDREPYRHSRIAKAARFMVVPSFLTDAFLTSLVTCRSPRFFYDGDAGRPSATGDVPSGDAAWRFTSMSRR